MTEQAKASSPPKTDGTSTANGLAAAEGRASLDREHLIAEYKQSQAAIVRELREKDLNHLEGMSEEEILDYAVEICRQD